ncbi:putative endonuclease from prophage, replication protein A (GpA) [Escherichia coli]|uniref:replication endonuclease n=1 Tax=Escherichia coli TaxID=562 RepID=UPI000E00AAC5|nr:replication endonuclease [Escherichia coli]STH47480.1 putative endonuclease from prophage, replication protein A (GpA) [Escherichia coli]STH52068.1 putative endonuclease from prophage, replication protein A (GpA) [Escherichia coli]HAI0884093.1 replication endonuclease [Escherichia coli]
MSDRNAQLAYPWNAPLPVIDPETFGRAQPTALRQAIQSYINEDIRIDARLDEETVSFLTNTDEGKRINSHLHHDEERRVRLEKLAKHKRENPPTVVSEAMAELRALPSFLASPLIRDLARLSRKQESARREGLKNNSAYAADNFVRHGLRARLKRIARVNERFATPAFKATAARERLDELLILPQLSRDEIQHLATLTATAFSAALERACDEIIEKTDRGDDDLFTWLLTYQSLAHMALKLGITPPCWPSLEIRPDRRTAPNPERVPGAVMRLSCATWWNSQLRHLRDIWREELLRAAGLVSRKTSVYISHEALLDWREKRQRTRDFLKAWDIENEEGERFSLEDIYWAGLSNPRNRRNEMMTCARGMEQVAEARGDVAFFVTVTAPSRFHSVNDDGSLNPKYCGTTVRDASDYLVYRFFAAVRRAIDKAGLGWYGVRTVEPHHDGTPHWHMLVFTSQENEARITEIMRNAAIREDRAELGDDISPRFKCEKIDPAKGTPTSYIATYIGKNLDASAFMGNDPKTGKPYIDKESGKTMAETVENAIGWAGLHRIHQFQFFGIPPRQVWRELRRLAGQMARNPTAPQRLDHDDIDAILAAADVGCFATYITRQGGVLIPRNTYLVRTAYETAEEANDYGEFPQRIYGVRAPLLGERYTICTHPDTWKLVRRKPENEDRTDEGFDVECGFAAPWTRGNNCPHDEKTDTGEGKTPPPETRKEQKLVVPGGDLGEWLRSLTPTERKQLTRQLKDAPSDTKTVKTGGPTTPDDVIHVRTALPLTDVTTTVIKSALSATGEELHSGAALSVHRGARVRLPDGRIVHWDEKSRSLVAADQPEVNP